MDDERFDDIIKRKVGEYEEPEFDPAALASLHHQLASSFAWPWYARYRTELITGTGIAICTLLVIWSQWYTGNHNARFAEKEFQLLKAQNEQIIQLQNEINHLKTVRPDTVRIVEYRNEPTPLYTPFLKRIAHLETIIKKIYAYDINDTRKVKGYAFPTDFLARSNNSAFGKVPPMLFVTILQEKPSAKSRRVTLDPTGVRSGNAHLSAKTIRDVERHYHRGLGIKIGPAIELSQGFYSQGEGMLNISGGLLTDLVLSPSLSLESGLKYGKRIYEISDHTEFLEVELPAADQSAGSLQNAEIDSWIVEVPMHLKYRYPVTYKTHWLVGAGYSPMIFMKQVFEYSYESSEGGDFFINSSHETKGIEFYPGSVNFSLGLSHELENKKTVEASVYYQHSLGNTGLEKNNSQYLGIRGIYWFTVR